MVYVLWRQADLKRRRRVRNGLIWVACLPPGPYSWPGLLSRAMSGSVTPLQAQFGLMLVAPVTTEGHEDVGSGQTPKALLVKEDPAATRASVLGCRLGLW